MKDNYRDTLDRLAFSEEQKRAMKAGLLEARQQQTTPTKGPRAKRLLPVAVAAALVLSLGTAGATGALAPAGEFFSHLLGGTAAQRDAADRMSSAVGVSATADGYTITVDGGAGGRVQLPRPLHPLHPGRHPPHRPRLGAGGGGQ